MSVQAVTTDTPCLGPYSPATKGAGLVFVSGQLGIKDGKLAEGVEEQTKVALENMKVILEKAGTCFGKVLKTTVFLKDMNHFDAMNKVYATFFTEFKPARICVEIARLPKDALVEIEAIAAE